MRSPIVGLKTASVVFGLMALAQIGRLLARPEILVNGWRMPAWPSALAVVFLAGLSAWLWSLTRPE